MSFERPGLQTIIDRISSDFQTRIDGADTLLRRSTLKVMSRVYAGAVHLLYGFLDKQSRQLFAFSADDGGLETIASEVGVVRKAAINATGAGTATGTTGTIIPASSELKSSSDERYLTDVESTLVAGTVSLDVTAKVAGVGSNDDAGITLTFISPIAGVVTTITIDSNGITGGIDEESDDDFRERVLLKKRQPPHGGIEVDYKNWALEVSGVTRAFTFPLFQGLGTIAVAFVLDDQTGSILPDATKRAEVLAYIIQHEDPATGEIVGVPVTAEPGLSVLTLSELQVDFNISLNPNTVTVQNAVTEELTSFIRREGGPGETLILSRMSEAISAAAGEISHTLNSPVADNTASSTSVHVLGTITWSSL